MTGEEKYAKPFKLVEYVKRPSDASQGDGHEKDVYDVTLRQAGGTESLGIFKVAKKRGSQYYSILDDYQAQCVTALLTREYNDINKKLESNFLNLLFILKSHI